MGLKIWKILATALAFQSFFWGGLSLAVAWLPLIALFTWRKDLRQERILAFIAASFRLFLKFLDVLGIVQYPQIQNSHNIPNQACVVVANHPSLIDVVALIAFVPFTSCVVKASLFHHRFFGGVVRWAGFISNQNGESMLKGARAVFSQNRPLIIFPEGTRSHAEGLNPFKQGPAQIALQCDVPLSPVLIQFSSGFLTKEKKWYHVPTQKVSFSLEFLELFWPKKFFAEQNIEPSSRKLTREIEVLLSTHTQSAKSL